MAKKSYYFVDLDVPDKSLRVDEYDMSCLKKDLKQWGGGKNISDLKALTKKVKASALQRLCLLDPLSAQAIHSNVLKKTDVGTIPSRKVLFIILIKKGSSHSDSLH